MKYWLIYLYPRSWRQRYETEFRALLEQRTLSLSDSFDIAHGAFDAHWTAMITQKEQMMFTMTLAIRRRTVMMLLIVLFGYVLSYGVCRAAGLLVHTSQNRYTPLSYHTISTTGANFSHSTAPLAVLYIPLRLVESAAWPIIDGETH